MVTSPVAVEVDTDVGRLYWASRRPRLVQVPELATIDDRGGYAVVWEDDPRLRLAPAG